MPGYLLDLDGTLYHGDRPIPGAADFVRQLRKQGYPFVFLTNNSSRTPQEVASHLEATGIEAYAEEVLTSSQAAAGHLLQLPLTSRRVYCIGEGGLRSALEEAGFELAGPSGEPGSVSAVVQGIDRSFDYGKLMTAVSHLRRGAVSVLTNPDHLLPWNGELTPGAGSLGASIERASGVVPIVIGKPSAIIMQAAIDKLGLPASDIWTVGDNLSTDIQGGIAIGTRTALVLTGLLTDAAAAESAIGRSGIRPDRICAHLQELLA
ncbi:4-nitrophenyl phosphatase [Paenibacillus sp. UNCCL117]|uniref:HAD-IIA family hydrolase n=1 Tax=unclassified Paenibacillus TaxID=185978 RepID=UPI00088332F9|nr:MULTISPECIES: HAD-IIA family hydrolase [unclassified Paenibacillus]SDD71436.1 4-nitrophenyl phosphatase [Paenibacillus sp. cl123]SFW45535.1 4-nitrophenyl phosphatase [Paenibacillus sp. UNCCL117]